MLKFLLSYSTAEIAAFFNYCQKDCIMLAVYIPLAVRSAGA